MKRILFLVLLSIITIHGYSQKEIETFICDCHHQTFKGLRYVEKKDSILFGTLITISNDLKQERYMDYHFSKVKSDNRIDTIDTSFKHLYGLYYYSSLNDISKKFKYGYIDDYSWSTNSVNGIKLEFDYVNTNPNTIKYIDVYFTLKNAVGDICTIDYSNYGKVRLIGPIEEYETGSYKTDVIGYASSIPKSMRITKIVLTYMNGKTYTLVKEIAYKYYNLLE